MVIHMRRSKIRYKLKLNKLCKYYIQRADALHNSGA